MNQQDMCPGKDKRERNFEMKRMKNYLFMLCAILIIASLTACGGEDSTPSGENGSGSVIKESGSPTFSGESLKFFGLGREEAFELLGEGGTTVDLKYLRNDKNGMEVNVTNTAEDMETYTVNQVRLSKDAGVTFKGMKVGDTLKDVDKDLMGDGATYHGNLEWRIKIDGQLYQIRMGSSDDKTISSIEATIMQDTGNGENQTPDLSNSFTYEEDLHDLEPVYWE